MKADRDKILDDASRLYTDVKVPARDREFVTENMSLDLPAADFLDEDVSADIWNGLHGLKPEQAGPKPETPAPESSDEESLASSIDSSGDDAEPEHIADIHKIETCKLVTGKAKKSWVHVVDPADDGLTDRWQLNCRVGLWRSMAATGDLIKMKTQANLSARYALPSGRSTSSNRLPLQPEGEAPERRNPRGQAVTMTKA